MNIIKKQPQNTEHNLCNILKEQIHEHHNNTLSVNIVNNIIPYGYETLKSTFYDALCPYVKEDLPDRTIINGNIIHKAKEPIFANVSITKDEYCNNLIKELISKYKYYDQKSRRQFWITRDILISQLHLINKTDFYNTDLGRFIKDISYSTGYDDYYTKRKQYNHKEYLFNILNNDIKSIIELGQDFLILIHDLDSLFDDYILCDYIEARREIKNILEYDIEEISDTYSNSKDRLSIVKQLFNESKLKWLEYKFIYDYGGFCDRLIPFEKTFKESVLCSVSALNNLNTTSYNQYIGMIKAHNTAKKEMYELEKTRYNIELEAIRTKIENHKNNILCLYNRYIKGEGKAIEQIVGQMLSLSTFKDLPNYQQIKRTDILFDKSSQILIIDYQLPSLTDMPNVKGYKYLKTKNSYESTQHSQREIDTLYEQLIYNIVIRSVMEVFHYDKIGHIKAINFNGYVTYINPAIGKDVCSCILSVQFKIDDFLQINPLKIDAKSCFKHFKGVSSSKLSTQTAIVPIMEIDKDDNRFVASHNIQINNSTNLAAMGWEDFEHLIRGLFEKEFSVNGGEVKVTQASRDGGVDAIAFDPDPIRGGKIVIQAKRYTNTVGVSAVRDLYGTVINEGANKGILITTSDYGADSYNFARAKPLTLLNGGHLLYLLEKHGEKARIDIEEARKLIKSGN